MIKSIIDTGPIVAFFDESDHYCKPIRSFLKEFDGKLYTTLAVATEVSYLLSDNREIQNSFIEWIKDGAITILNQDNKDFKLVYFFMDKYSDRPMDFADATIMTISEIHEIKNLITFDKDFLFYKSKKGKVINILNSKMMS